MIDAILEVLDDFVSSPLFAVAFIVWFVILFTMIAVNSCTPLVIEKSPKTRFESPIPTPQSTPRANLV